MQVDRLVEIGPDCIIPPGVAIEPGVRIGPRVTFAGPNIIIGKHAVLEPACIVGDGVTIGQGALIRAGAVVLRSVPPNAVVEGNPAQVVGYVERHDMGHRAPAGVVDMTHVAGLKAPAKVLLGVGSSALHLMRRVADARGALSVGEVASELPFRPERYFLVFDVPSIELRGEHAHKICEQFLICVHGACRILLDDSSRRCEVTLDRPDLGVYMPPMIWGTQYKYTRDAVLLVFASHAYDANDYLRTYDDFLGCRDGAAQ